MINRFAEFKKRNKLLHRKSDALAKKFCKTNMIQSQNLRQLMKEKNRLDNCLLKTKILLLDVKRKKLALEESETMGKSQTAEAKERLKSNTRKRWKRK